MLYSVLRNKRLMRKFLPLNILYLVRILKKSSIFCIFLLTKRFPCNIMYLHDFGGVFSLAHVRGTALHI